MGSYLGQHFLIDQTIINHICTTVRGYVGLGRITSILEIGPGKGAITRGLFDICPQFTAVEYDPLMVDYLTNKFKWDKNHILVNKNALDWDWNTHATQYNFSPSKTFVVGNIPYYITSPLLKRFCEGDFAGMYCMIQNDVAQKIRSDAKKKNYLWRILNMNNTVVYESFVPASAFSPTPKVSSAMVTIMPRPVSLIQKEDKKDFFAVLDCLSHAKRKTIGSNRKRGGYDISTLPTFLAKKRLEECNRTDMEILCEIKKTHNKNT